MAIKTYKVNDFWLDIEKKNHVDIESTDGVITSVKNNGEDIGGGGGGSSDFSTAKVTVVNNTGDEAAQGLLMTIIDEGTSMLVVNGLPSGTFTVPLYKGVLYTAYVSGRTATVSGNAEYDDGDLTIKGDCTITIS